MLISYNTDDFLSSTSFNGLCALYCLSLSFENHQAFNKAEVFNEILNDEDYSFGFIIACSSLGLLDFNIKKEIITVIKINLSSTEIKKKLEELVNNEFIDSIEKINNIEAFF